MHQWDDKVFAILREQAGKLNKFFPRGLDHALTFDPRIHTNEC